MKCKKMTCDGIDTFWGCKYVGKSRKTSYEAKRKMTLANFLTITRKHEIKDKLTACGLPLAVSLPVAIDL